MDIFSQQSRLSYKFVDWSLFLSSYFGREQRYAANQTAQKTILPSYLTGNLLV